MKRTLRCRLTKHYTAMSALAAAAAVGGAVKSAEATIVYHPAANIVVPSTAFGVYLNVVTGVNGVTGGSVAGWDVSPYGTTVLEFYNPTTPSTIYVARTGGGGVGNLPPGQMIDGTATFLGSSSLGNTTGNQPFVLNSSNNIVGFRFQNEAMGNQIQYGWMRLSLSAGTGTQPRTIVEWAYEDTGVGILAGATTTATSGACCFFDGSCTPNVTSAACTGSGGVFNGSPTCTGTCVANGACCMPDGTCSEGTQTACTNVGGAWQNNVHCGAANCPPAGACCTPAGVCSNLTSAACTASGGTWSSGNTCATFNCPGTWAESGDAGNLPASTQLPTGTGSLVRISGNLTAGDVDLYEIGICDHANFSASTVGNTTTDTVLFVFGPTGLGLTYDDDTAANFQSLITGQFIPNNGNYYLGITTFGTAPTSAGALIWNAQPYFPERAPDGLGAAGVVDGYNVGSGSGPYAITLTGTCFPNLNATGACCANNGSCTTVTAAACVSSGGAYQGDGVACGSCPQPGACCLSNGTCSLILQTACTTQGGTWSGGTCAAANCPPAGACCKFDGTCTSVTQAACNGVWTAGACGTCPPPPPTFYSNCNLATGPTTLDGTAAPAGTQWSEVARDETDTTTANTNAGYSAALSAGFREADDFVIPAGGMNVGYIKFASYQTGATSPTITGVTVRILSTPPNDPSPVVVFGDTTTNRLATPAVFAPIYRAFNTVVPITCGGAPTGPDQTRHIQYVYAAVNQVLPAGTYWFDVQMTGSTSFSGPWMPASTDADSIGRTCTGNNSNSMVFDGTTWVANVDAGVGCNPSNFNQDLYFEVLGTPATVACYANCDASTTAPVLNVADFTCFLQKYAAGSPYANCDASTTAPVLNVADFTCFLQKYAAGCP